MLRRPVSSAAADPVQTEPGTSQDRSTRCRPRLALSIPADRYRVHQTAIDSAVAEVFRSGRFILGEQTVAFEREFAAFLGVDHCVGVGNGTDAIEIALRACGIGPGEAVLTVAHTAVATVAAIERTGASVVLVDIDPLTFTMDPESLRATIAAYQADSGGNGRPRLKAVVPVHLYGCPADLPAIQTIAHEYGLRVIEDCAQAHGAMLERRMTGAWGDLAAFSFYPTKNLGAFGDGGAVVTKDAALAEQVGLLRQYGWKPRRISSIRGCNSRLDELQAAILRVLLKHLPNENARRREVASRYDVLLAGTQLSLPPTRPSCAPVFHQYVVRTPYRDALRASLEADGIPTQIHYPVPVHLQPAYQGRLFLRVSSLPLTEIAAREVLSLPMSPYLTPDQFERIREGIRRWLNSNGGPE
ncbi:MAG: DegT/DnrJ/EryC1/StrS family aminotransferase [Verrucomicrobia bacterium]|nr:DegT/DnrJ/EryC1/StrS family aminotransferase [Verrucomicrobiota bacterium]